MTTDAQADEAMAAGAPRALGLRWAPSLALALVLVSFMLPLATTPVGSLRWTSIAGPFVFAACGLFAALLALRQVPRSAGEVSFFCLMTTLAAVAPLWLLGMEVTTALGTTAWLGGFWCYVVALALLAAIGLRRCAALTSVDALGRYGTPLLFALWVLVFWQLATRGFDIPQVLLPAPSRIGQAFVGGFGVLVGDFLQTVLHAALIGGVVGCALGFGVGVLIDRCPFLRRGLLPLAALASAMPLVGIAPVMVMWFGFDWHSKAAVVALMTFFPMLVNTLAGLAACCAMERDLMRSYGAGYWRTLVLLRIPVALPFIFNALKIDSTLAMIGAIVAEFFGSPTAGLGFRISTEAARLNMGLVWAAIGVAAVAGSLLYALIGWAERRATFWHPSIREER